MSNTKKDDCPINRLAVLWHLNGCVVTFYEETPAEQEQKRVPIDTVSFTTKAYLGYRDVDLLRIASPAVPYLENLTCLQLQNNNLQYLPEELWRLTNLRELNIGYNQLETIPAKLGHLTQLEEFFLHNNKLQQIPTQIRRLKQLHVLDLTDNQLTELPGELLYLEKLRQLWIDNNPFVSYTSTFKETVLQKGCEKEMTVTATKTTTTASVSDETPMVVLRQGTRVMPLKSICMQMIGLLCLNDEESRNVVQTMSTSGMLPPDIQAGLLPDDITIAPECYICSSTLFHDSLELVRYDHNSHVPLVFKACNQTCLSALLNDIS